MRVGGRTVMIPGSLIRRLGGVITRRIQLRGSQGILMLSVVASRRFGAWTALARAVVAAKTELPLPGGSMFQGGDGNSDGLPAVYSRRAD
jgi:hypothetical protein